MAHLNLVCSIVVVWINDSHINLIIFFFCFDLFISFYLASVRLSSLFGVLLCLLLFEIAVLDGARVWSVSWLHHSGTPLLNGPVAYSNQQPLPTPVGRQQGNRARGNQKKTNNIPTENKQKKFQYRKKKNFFCARRLARGNVWPPR